MVNGKLTICFAASDQGIAFRVLFGQPALGGLESAFALLFGFVMGRDLPFPIRATRDELPPCERRGYGSRNGRAGDEHYRDGLEPHVAFLEPREALR